MVLLVLSSGVCSEITAEDGNDDDDDDTAEVVEVEVTAVGKTSCKRVLLLLVSSLANEKRPKSTMTSKKTVSNAQNAWNATAFNGCDARLSK